MKRVKKSPGQLVLLHICSGCNQLVPYGVALRWAPNSPGANEPMHPACLKAEDRWVMHADNTATNYPAYTGRRKAAP